MHETSLDCEILVVGGGICGLLVARRLIAAGADVRLVDAGSPSLARLPAMTVPGPLDPPDRVAASLGDEPARRLWELSLRSADILEELNPAAGRGVLLGASDVTERRSLEASQSILDRWAIPFEPFDALHLGRCGVHFEFGLLFSWATRHDGAILLSSARQAIESSAPGVLLDGRVAALRVDADGIEFAVASAGGQRRSRCQLVVLATNARIPQLAPALEGKIVGVRGQFLRLHGSAPVTAPWGISTNWGHEIYSGSGRQWIAGGINPDPGLQDLVLDIDPTPGFQRILEGRARVRLPVAVPFEVVDRWGSVAAFTSDGLPVVGPLPGNPRVMVAGGWNARGFSFAPAAAEELTRLILLGRSDLPECFDPRRFL